MVNDQFMVDAEVEAPNMTNMDGFLQQLPVEEQDNVIIPTEEQEDNVIMPAEEQDNVMIPAEEQDNVIIPAEEQGDVNKENVPVRPKRNRRRIRVMFDEETELTNEQI